MIGLPIHDIYAPGAKREARTALVSAEGCARLAASFGDDACLGVFDYSTGRRHPLSPAATVFAARMAWRNAQLSTMEIGE